MRKKINFQAAGYKMNGEQICFGISEHLVQEYFPTLSQKA